MVFLIALRVHCVLPGSERERAGELLQLQQLQGLPPGLQPPERLHLCVPVCRGLLSARRPVPAPAPGAPLQVSGETAGRAELAHPSWAGRLQGGPRNASITCGSESSDGSFITERTGITEKTCECLLCVEKKDAILPLKLKLSYGVGIGTILKKR